nr:MAG TPA: PROTEIN (MANNOSE-BINDING PROTEIN A), HOST DEFENSE, METALLOPROTEIN, SUGAR.9A [Caudoviricetes sp.]
MKYVKQHFVTGMKINLADVLNRMEDGIAAACAAAVEGIGTVTTGDAPAARIRGGKLCLTLPRGEPGPQGDPGEGLSDNAKALLLSLLAGETEDRDAALKALREEWGVADRSTDTETAAAERGA